MLRSRVVWLGVVVIALVVLGVVLAVWPRPPIVWGSGVRIERPEVSFEERKLATIPEGVDVMTLGETLNLPPRGAGVSMITPSKIPAVFFSPDGRQVAYCGRYAGKEIVFVDDKDGKGFDRVGLPTFSLDGKHVAYRAAIGNRSVNGYQPDRLLVVVDGQTKEVRADWLSDPTLSPDGTQVAYRMWIRSSNTWAAFVGQRKINEYDEVGDPVFSPDGQSGGFWATKSGRAFVVLGNQRQGDYRDASDPVFSEDGVHVAYWADRASLVLDGVPGNKYSPRGAPAFSPDGKHVAFMANAPEGGTCLVVDGMSHEADHREYPLVFSPDGRKVAVIDTFGRVVVVEDGKTRWVYEPEHTHHDHAEHFRANGSPAFSPDGTILAVPGGGSTPTTIKLFGPNRVIRGEFDYVWSPVFSRDGKKLAFGARKGREIWWKVVDVQ